MRFVSIETVPEMHSCGHFEQQNAFCEHSNCTQNALASEWDWQANAFKWSFWSSKMHVVSIQTVSKMHLLLSGIGKQMHSNRHLGAAKCIS